MRHFCFFFLFCVKVDMRFVSRKIFILEHQKPENQICADCKIAHTDHFSPFFGCFLCPNCAIIHNDLFGPLRNRTTRSINDYTPTILDRFLVDIGNLSANEHYEYSLDVSDKPDPNSTDSMRTFIENKYKHQKWARQSIGPRRQFSLIGRFFEASYEFLKVGLFFIFFLCIIILVFSLFLSEFRKYSALNIILGMEVYGWLYPIEIEPIPYFIIQIIIGMFGLGFFKGLLTTTAIKLVTEGIKFGKNCLILYPCAFILIWISYGFEHLLICLMTFCVLSLCFSAIFQEVYKHGQPYFGPRI